MRSLFLINLKKMKKRYLIPVITGLTLLTAGSAFAYGWNGFNGLNSLEPEQIAERHQFMFENQADLLGIDIATVKNYWAEGKSMREIMTEEGIDEEVFRAKMQEQRREEMKLSLQDLVDQGVITQDQANQRMNSMQNGEMMHRHAGRMNQKRDCPWVEAD